MFNTERLWSVKEAADLLHVNGSVILGMAEGHPADSLKCFELDGRHYIDPVELEHWLDRGLDDVRARINQSPKE